jgi:hypothetical protein
MRNRQNLLHHPCRQLADHVRGEPHETTHSEYDESDGLRNCPVPFQVCRKLLCSRYFGRGPDDPEPDCAIHVDEHGASGRAYPGRSVSRSSWDFGLLLCLLPQERTECIDRFHRLDPALRIDRWIVTPVFVRPRPMGIDLYRQKKHTIDETCQAVGISRATLYAYVEAANDDR